MWFSVPPKTNTFASVGLYNKGFIYLDVPISDDSCIAGKYVLVFSAIFQWLLGPGRCVHHICHPNRLDTYHSEICNNRISQRKTFLLCDMVAHCSVFYLNSLFLSSHCCTHNIKIMEIWNKFLTSQVSLMILQICPFSLCSVHNWFYRCSVLSFDTFTLCACLIFLCHYCLSWLYLLLPFSFTHSQVKCYLSPCVFSGGCISVLTCCWLLRLLTLFLLW